MMEEENRLHAGEPPALHIASDAIAQSRPWHMAIRPICRPCKVRVPSV